MKKIIIKSVLCFVFFMPLFFHLFNFTSRSITTELKDQLSSAQLSYFGKLGLGNTVGNSIIYIGGAGYSGPSANNFNLDIGDTLSIGSTNYIVTGLADTNAISLNTAIGAGGTLGTYVLSPRYSVHSVYFKPQTSATGGKWQVLIKTSNGIGSTDGLPDIDGFDYGTLNQAAITCPFSATATVGTTAVISSVSYHVITCSLGAGVTNPVNVGTSIIIGNATNMLMNPAPAASHTIGQANGTADTYTVMVRHLDSASTIIDEDTTTAKIALTESVRITATVDPTLTFTISNVGVTNAGTTLCGSAIGNGAIDTTAASVNFGSLNLNASNNLAQLLSCTTNATNGYSVQTFESGRLTMIGAATTIPDTVCDGSCTYSVGTTWGNVSNSGFGYSIQVGTTYAGASIGITNPGYYKAFGLNYAQAQTILSRTTVPASTESIYVCYRITVSTGQPAGTYQNEVNYIATATF